MREVAADRAAVTNLPVADLAGRLCQRRCGCLHVSRVGDLMVCNTCADAQTAIGATDALQCPDAADIDQRSRRCQPQLHHWD